MAVFGPGLFWASVLVGTLRGADFLERVGSSDVDGDEEGDHGRGEGEDAEAVQEVPAVVLAQRLFGGGVGRGVNQAVVDGDEEAERKNDHEGPDRAGCDEQRNLWGMAEQDCFNEKEHEAQHIPEGHGGAEAGGKGLELGEPGAVVEAAKDRVDKGRYRELGADKKPERERGDDVQDHGGCLFFCLSGIRRGVEVH